MGVFFLHVCYSEIILYNLKSRELSISLSLVRCQSIGFLEVGLFFWIKTWREGLGDCLSDQSDCREAFDIISLSMHVNYTHYNNYYM